MPSCNAWCKAKVIESPLQPFYRTECKVKVITCHTESIPESRPEVTHSEKKSKIIGHLRVRVHRSKVLEFFEQGQSDPPQCPGAMLKSSDLNAKTKGSIIKIMQQPLQSVVILAR